MTNEAAMKAFIESFGPEPQATVANFEKRREWIMRKQGFEGCLEHLRKFDDADAERIRDLITDLRHHESDSFRAEEMDQAAADLTALLDALAAERELNAALRLEVEGPKQKLEAK